MIGKVGKVNGVSPVPCRRLPRVQRVAREKLRRGLWWQCGAVVSSKVMIVQRGRKQGGLRGCCRRKGTVGGRARLMALGREGLLSSRSSLWSTALVGGRGLVSALKCKVSRDVAATVCRHKDGSRADSCQRNSSGKEQMLLQTRQKSACRGLLGREGQLVLQ